MSLMRPATTRLTQDFDGSFYMERPGYLRTDLTIKRGCRWRWNRKAIYRKDLHLGEDYGGAEGTPVYAVHSGKIVKQGRDGTGGYFIYQQVRVGRIYKIIALYYHLKPYSFRFRQGDYVRRGQVIARMGNTGGSSTGSHLHFQLIRYLRGVASRYFYTGANAKVSLGLTGLSFDPQPFYGVNGKPLSVIAP